MAEYPFIWSSFSNEESFVGGVEVEAVPGGWTSYALGHAGAAGDGGWYVGQEAIERNVGVFHSDDGEYQCLLGLNTPEHDRP